MTTIRISANDLLGTAGVHADVAVGMIEKAREQSSLTDAQYCEIEDRLLDAIAETRAARYLVSTRLVTVGTDEVDDLVTRHRPQTARV